MSISDATGNINRSNRNIAEVISSANSTIEGIIGGAKSSIGSIGILGKSGESFAGMDSDNIVNFETAIDRYRDDIQSIIDGFNADADMDMALKGEVATAAHEFLAQVKGLLDAYVAAIDVEKKEIREANDNFLAAAGAISGDITSDSDSIRSTASGITID